MPIFIKNVDFGPKMAIFGQNPQKCQKRPKKAKKGPKSRVIGYYALKRVFANLKPDFFRDFRYKSNIFNSRVENSL